MEQKHNPYHIFILNSNGNLEKEIIYGTPFSDELNDPIKYYSTQQIHQDDSIHEIKNKIIYDLYKINPVSYDEIYLFSAVNKKINLLNVYQEITKNETVVFSQALFNQFLLKFVIDKETLKTVPQKTSYKFEDILFLLNKPIRIPIGKRFANYDDYFFSVNPFELNSAESLFYQTNSNPLLSFENELLLNYGTLINNTIYVCLARDVFSNSPKNQDKIAEYYFPFLFKNDIINESELEKNREQLLEKTRVNVNEKTIANNETIDVFYDIYANPDKSAINYKDSGIYQFHLILPPDQNKIMPLDAIFKNIHANESVPFIKYNPGNRRENIYRLYAKQKSKNGKNIPFLVENTVLKLSRELGKKYRISFYVPVKIENNKSVDFFVDIEKNGNIHVYSGEWRTPISFSKIDEILLNNINPLIQTVNDFLEQTGYHLRLYEKTENSAVPFKKINYRTSVELMNTIDLTKYMYCISSIFDIISKDLSKGAKLRYKKVENFKELEGQALLITETLKESGSIQDAINILMENYKITELVAAKKVQNHINEHADLRGIIVENPGFPTIFRVEPFTKNLTIEIENILSNDYLMIIEMYIDGILRIIQKIEDTEIVKNICKKRDIENPVEKIDDVVYTVAKPVLQKKEIRPISFFTEEKEDTAESEDKGEDEDDEEEFEYLFDYSDENEEQTGGQNSGNTNSGDEYKINPDGMSLSHPNIFFKRLKERDPALFLSSKNGKFDSYSRICPSNTDLQPVILTDDELKKINPSSYTKTFKYGSDENHQFNYVCPRYWCLKTGKSMTQEEVDSGECGKIIPKTAKKVPAGHYVYEFTSKKEHFDKNGKYVDHYPGFKDPSSHPDNKCIPCCFSQWDSKIQKQRRQQCINPEKEPIVKKEKPVNNNYILSVESFPLEKGRLGKVPIPVQLFLNIEYSKKILNLSDLETDDNNNIFRYGVEQKRNQSFLGCLSDIYAAKQSLSNTPTVEQLKKIMTDPSIITLDHFIRYYNASLVSVFKPKQSNLIKTEDIDISPYEQTDFYKSIDITNEIQFDFFRETVASYENFFKYLKNDDIEIDHTYLWDMFIDDNPKFISGGVNLCIIEIANNDITDNIEILCPTNSYLNNFYDKKKETVILLKHAEFYEPLYLYSVKKNPKTEKQETSIIKGFRDSVKIKPVLETIRIISKNYCSPKNSLPRVYSFKRNIALNDLQLQLDKIGHKIKQQIMNYHNKIIGVSMEINNKLIFVPCFPSAPLTNITIKYMDDKNIWTTYNLTRKILDNLSQESDGKILCKPTHKIIDDGLVVGLLTETNQFVRVDPPELVTNDDGLIPLTNTDYLIADQKIMSNQRNKEQDKERETTVKKIELETQFYSVFRSILKIILSKYENRELRESLLEIIKNAEKSARQKRGEIEKIVRELMETHVNFVEYEPDVLYELNEISSCFSHLDNKKYCLTSTSNSSNAIFMIPIDNLITQKSNNMLYFKKISDEILRYSRIQMFLFYSNVFLIQTEYKINLDEFIILQSLLTPEYFKDLLPFNSNSYIENITYEFADPALSQKYSDLPISNEEQQTEMENDEIQNNCIDKIFPKIKGNNISRWVKAFPNKTKELLFSNDSTNCSFEILIQILKMKNADNSKENSDINLVKVKNAIYRGYSKYLPKTKEKLYTMLSNEGKTNIVKQLNDNNRIVSLEEMIMSEEYYLSDLDIWMFANEMKIPIVLFSSTNLKTINWKDPLTVEKDWMILYGDKTQPFYFIRSPTQDKSEALKNKVPKYMLIYGDFMLTKLSKFGEIIDKAFSGSPEYRENIRSLDNYLGEETVVLKRKKKV